MRDESALRIGGEGRGVRRGAGGSLWPRFEFASVIFDLAAAARGCAVDGGRLSVSGGASSDVKDEL